MGIWANFLKDSFQGKNIGPDGKKLKRSGKWSEVRKEHLKKNPKCAVCESTTNLDAHHCIPFAIAPEKELEPNNLITLCSNKKYGIHCHLAIGHCGSWRKINPNVKIDATTWNMKLKG